MKNNKNHPQYTFELTKKLKNSNKINTLQQYTYNGLSVLFSIPILNNIIDIRLVPQNQCTLLASIAHKTQNQISFLGINIANKAKKQIQMGGFQKANYIQEDQAQWAGWQIADTIRYNQFQIIGGIEVGKNIGGRQEQSIGYQTAENIGYKQRQWFGYQKTSHAKFGQEQGLGVQKNKKIQI
jgi:hypothetical protein